MQRPTQTHSNQNTYSYRVKLINPVRKKDSVIRELRKFRGRFKSVTEMKIRLMEEFEEQIPETTKFGIGYIEGRQSTKRWICCDDDIAAMYTAYATCPEKEIMLWCDSRCGGDNNEDNPKSKRRKTNDVSSKREENEQRVAEIADELKEQHEKKLKLNEVQYRLWARMLVTGVHSSRENPPQVPMITGSTPRRKPQNKEFQESIVSTAAAVVKAITQNSPNSSTIQSPQIQQTINEHPAPQTSGHSRELGVSPGKASEIRGKSFSQLATLKQLYEDSVLTLNEFEEQKGIILSGLKKL